LNKKEFYLEGEIMSISKDRKLFVILICIVCILLQPLVGDYALRIAILLCGFVFGFMFTIGVAIIISILYALFYGSGGLYLVGIPMLIELLVLGVSVGALYRKFPKKFGFIYISLILAVLLGFIANGAAAAMLLWVYFGLPVYDSLIHILMSASSAIRNLFASIIFIPFFMFALQKLKIKKDHYDSHRKNTATSTLSPAEKDVLRRQVVYGYDNTRDSELYEQTSGLARSMLDERE